MMRMTIIQQKDRAPKPATSGWIRYRSVAYLTGRGLAFGVGADIFPRVATAPGKYSLNMDILPNPQVSVCDGRADVFQDDSFDHLVVGPQLAVCPSPAGQLRELARKLKMRGHLVLYLVKDPGNDPNVRFKFDASSLRALLAESGAWRVKYENVRGNDMVIIAKKIAGSKGTIQETPKPTGKRACIVRYGALGDMVMITPLIRKLAADGYAVTMNITPYALPLLENNPYVSNIIIQEREAIPNLDLGDYWKEWESDYDKYINLSESIEGKLLKVEGRRDYFTSSTWRRSTCGGENYYDWTMKLGGYPEERGHCGELFFSKEELRKAAQMRKEFGDKLVIGWGLKGSSYHKIYPLIQAVVNDLCEKHPNVIVVLLGGPESVSLEFDHPQVIRTSGKWSIRESSVFIAKVADLVVGPESLVTNIAGCYDIPKITFLSHSSHDNLCKYWSKDFCMEPDTKIAQCYPCHQLHYSLESCPQAEIRHADTGEIVARGPICAMGAIDGKRVLDRIEEAMLATARMQAAVV